MNLTEWLGTAPNALQSQRVDCYIGATESIEDDPLNKVYPGEFNYGGGHVIQDLVAGKKVHLKATAYGTDCYPNREVEKEVPLRSLPQATLCKRCRRQRCAIRATAIRIIIVRSI